MWLCEATGKFLWTCCPQAPLTPALSATVASSSHNLSVVTHPWLPATSHQSSGVESLRGLDLRRMSRRKTPCQAMHVAGEQIVRTIWLTVRKRSLSAMTWNLHTKAATAREREREEMRWLRWRWIRHVCTTSANKSQQLFFSSSSGKTQHKLFNSCVQNKERY